MSRPIPVERANAMIETYLSYMESHEINMQEQTHCVSFRMPHLLDWLNNVAPYSDEIRICMGVYAEGEYAGHITTILWPYKDGQPAIKPSESGEEEEIEPFNEGTGNP